jgi:N-acetylglucosamine-6-phosphate deacetylase
MGTSYPSNCVALPLMEEIIFAAKLYTGTSVLENQLIVIENRKIKAITPGIAAAANKSVLNLAPGFIDTHINGGDKFHFTQNAAIDGVEDIDRSCKRLGTSYTLPSLITSPLENIYKGIDAIRQYQTEHPDSGVLGMHLEGPFLNPVKRGAHLLAYIKKPETAELKALINQGKDVIRLLTIAPEMFSPDQISLLLDSGITIAAGHSNATYEEASAAFNQGIKLVTHLYNAMSPFQHRKPGLVGATFDHDDVYAPIILDGQHCDFAAARIAYQVKKDKLFLISDALFTGRKIRNFQWETFDASLINDQYVNSEGNLAGAAISLGEAIYNAVHEVGIPIQEAIEMATIRPANAIGQQDVAGRIEIGYPAVFTAFDDALQHFAVI